MTGRHSGGGPNPLRAVLAAAVVLAVVALVLVIRHRSTSTDQAATTPPTVAPPTLAGPTVADTPAPTSSTPDSPTTSAAVPTASTARVSVASYPAVDSLIDEAPAGGVSVSAYNTVTGKTITLGATHGMIEASVSKLALLEILLLEHQDAHTTLSDHEDDELQEMIEQSSNEAADDVFDLAGGHDTVVAHQAPLGLNTNVTIYGSGNLWGLTTSSAAQQIVLLKNLVETDSPLDAKSRAYALGLLEDVESDQRWGVPVAADPGTSYAVKNGWLAVDDDHDLWAVNSDGIITADGQRLLVSVMSQHGQSFDAGIDYDEKLVKAVVAAIT
ncbi:hypothetical protein [Jatrophihabitans sp.]|uniref:hypothetical protein n=1 Tax=Jatrophihabitans sp. TaxID=1932789 RepID=UPI0030C700A3|nr:hypothetical protein [Jatrophihabitans sp.]